MCRDFVVEAARRRITLNQEQAAAERGGAPITDDVRSSLLQVAAGLAHLHAQKIVHRDLKPHNILCCSPDTVVGSQQEPSPGPHGRRLGTYVLKISDMGLSRQLDRDHHSFSSASLSLRRGPGAGALSSSRGLTPGGADAEAEAVGTVGWQAPELVRHRYSAQSAGDDAESEADPALRRRTLTVDVFSLGCVFYFTLTLGGHPFGQWFEREANIAADRADLSGVRHDPLAWDLLSWMLQPNPLRRPSSSQVCAHAFFWPAARRLDFLVEFSDRLEQEPAEAAAVVALEAGAAEISGGGNWHAQLDPQLLSDLSRYRRYDTASVRDLLRVVRNKRHHYHELSSALKLAMGAVPEGFLRYFESRFPQLLLHCAAVAGRHLAHEPTFSMCVCAIAPREERSAAGAGWNAGTTEPAPSGVYTFTESLAKGSINTLLPAVDLAAATTAQRESNREWWVTADSWVRGAGANSVAAEASRKARAGRMSKISQDSKYRTRLCSQWEESGAAVCSMRRKGRCDFAHGPLELRAKESRRGKWGKTAPLAVADTDLLAFSGGENCFGEARLMEAGRKAPLAPQSRPRVVQGHSASPARTAARTQLPPAYPSPQYEPAYTWEQHQHYHQHQPELGLHFGLPQQQLHHFSHYPQQRFGAVPGEPYGGGLSTAYADMPYQSPFPYDQHPTQQSTFAEDSGRPRSQPRRPPYQG
jgi:serine/threonine protein kinase